MPPELLSVIAELTTEIYSATHPSQQGPATSSPSVIDQCQQELDDLDALGTEFDTWMADFKARLRVRLEAYLCCRVAYPLPVPQND